MFLYFNIQGNQRGAYTDLNQKKQGVYSLFNSPNQYEACLGFLNGVLQDSDEDSQQKIYGQEQIPNFMQKQKPSIQKRLFNEHDCLHQEQFNINEERQGHKFQPKIRRLKDITEQKNQGEIGQNDIYQKNQYNQQQQGNISYQYAQTTFKEKQENEGSLLNLNIRSSRNLLFSFQQSQKEQKFQEDEQKFSSQLRLQQISNQPSQTIQFEEKQQNLESENNQHEFGKAFSGLGKKMQKSQYLIDQINQFDSQTSSSNLNQNESSQSEFQNKIFSQFQNQQKPYQHIALKSKLPSSQHQQQQLIEMNRFKGFQNKKNTDCIFQTQTQLSSASSIQNQLSSNKENSQNTSHSSTSSSGLSLHPNSESGNANTETQNMIGVGQNTNYQKQFSNCKQNIQVPSSQKKLQQQLQKEINQNIFLHAQTSLCNYQTSFISLKQQSSQASVSNKNYLENHQLQLSKQSSETLSSKQQLFENSSQSKPQNFSTSSSSLSSSQSQMQSSNHPSCSSPSSQSSSSSEAHNTLSNLSFSSFHKISLSTSSSRLQSQMSRENNLASQQQQNSQIQSIQNFSSGKGGKQFGSSGKKSQGKNKQIIFYEKPMNTNPVSNSLPYQTPIKQDVPPISIAACQEDNYQNQYGFNSPLYTPSTKCQLYRIKESFYESTPINEFKQRFARKIKQLRQELKENDCKTPEGSQFNACATPNTQPGSSILQKEIKQKLTFIEILGQSIAKLGQIKTNMYWKLMFELADFAKKDCMYHEAKYFYKIAINLQPFCPDIWLEYAKMEEDYGNLQKAKEILENAYPFCKMSDSLILKLLRIIEKIGTIDEVRKLLSNLSQLKIEKCWKIYIEGAFIEIRFGNLKNAERILKMLHKYLDFNGQVCYEYARILELQGKYNQALNICLQAQEKGLKCTSLWTLYLKLYEKTCSNIECGVLDKFIRLANQSLPKEIIWKIYLEISQICEKKNEIFLAKQYLLMSIRNAHDSMKWKSLIQVAKIELLQGNVENANYIIQKTMDSCSDKQKPYIIIEAAKCSEIQGDILQALSLMASLKSNMKSEWKIYMEYISMLIRNKEHKEAGKVIKESLNMHTLAGRLWGELIQLEHIKATNNDLNSAFEFFLVALEEVPKSGEVWCEGARLCMNPFGNKFDLQKAKQFLEYAIFFTPQYGDSFIEALRLYTILGDREQIKQLKSKTIISQPNYGHLWYYMKDTTRDTSIDVWKRMKKLIKDEVSNTFIYYQKKFVALEQSSSNKNQTPMITAFTEYNNLFFKDQIPKDIRWKTIFYLDQSLNQI